MPDALTETRDRIADALFGRTKRSVLALLFGRPGESFYLRQIARETGAGTGAVQRELAQLTEAGLVRRVPQGRQVYFSADPASPVFDELRSLLAKTAGIADVLRAALVPLAQHHRLMAAFIYGSVAEGRHSSASDVDLLIIGDVQLSDLLPALGPAQEQLGREINPTVYSPDEFRQKLNARRHFIRRVLDRPRIMLIGTNHDLEELARESLARRA